MQQKVELTSRTVKFLTLESVRNVTGKICTVLGKKFILSLLHNHLELVLVEKRTLSDNENFPFSQHWSVFQNKEVPKSGCRFVFQNGRPFLLKDLEDGTEVMFDAIRYPGDSSYEAIVVWIGPSRPAIVAEPLANSYVLYNVVKATAVKIVSLQPDGSGSILFYEENTPVLFRFFKTSTKLYTKELCDKEWNPVEILQNCSKFLGNIYEFRNENSPETPMYVCPLLFINKESISMEIEEPFQYNTLYNFDSCKNVLYTNKPYGSTMYCNINAKFAICKDIYSLALTFDKKILSFNSKLNDIFREKLRFRLENNMDPFDIKVYVKEIYFEQQKSVFWNLFIILNKNEKNSYEEIILKTFSENLESKSDNDIAVNGIQHQYSAPEEASHWSTASAREHRDERKISTRLPHSKQPINVSVSNQGMIVPNPIKLDLSDTEIKRDINENNCLIHPNIHKQTINEKSSTPKCFSENLKDVDTTPIKQWGAYFSKNDSQLVDPLEDIEKRRELRDPLVFMNSFIKSETKTDKLQSIHNFDNTLGKISNLKKLNSKFPSSLLDSDGIIFTTGGQSYIKTKVFNESVVVTLNLTNKNILQFSNNVTPGLLWDNQKPVSLSEIKEGFEVKFDAVIAPGSDYFQAIFIWTGKKPDFVPFVKQNAYLLANKYMNAKVTPEYSPDNNELKLTFLEGDVSRTCEPLDNTKFKANKAKTGHIFKLIQVSHYATVNHYVFSGLRDCIQLDYGKQYQKQDEPFTFNVIKKHKDLGLYLNVPITIVRMNDSVVFRFCIQDQNITIATEISNGYLQDLICSLGENQEGVAYIFKLSEPFSFKIFFICLKNCKTDDIAIENQYQTHKRSDCKDKVFVFDLEKTNFTLMDEDDIDISMTNQQRTCQNNETEANIFKNQNDFENLIDYINMLKPNFSPPKVEVHKEEQRPVFLEGKSKPLDEDQVKRSKKPVPGDIPKRMDTLNRHLKCYQGKVPSHMMCYPTVFRNCTGTMYNEKKTLIIDVKLNSKGVKLYPVQGGYLQYGGKIMKLSKVEKPKDVKLDAFYDMETKRYKITALWIGTKQNYLKISDDEHHYIDVVGQFMGRENNNMSLNFVHNGRLFRINTYHSKRIFSEKGTIEIDDLIPGCPILIHLKKSINGNRYSWEILMLIELTDKIIADLYPTSGVVNLVYTENHISQLNRRKKQITEIGKIWKELITNHFSIIHGRIVSGDLELMTVEGTYDQNQYQFVLSKNKFLDRPLSSTEIANCEVFLLALPQPNLWSPLILVGWFNRLLGNCYILVDHTHEQLDPSTVKLTCKLNDNHSYAHMNLKNIVRLKATHSQVSLYYLVQNVQISPPKIGQPYKIDKEVLLASDDWLLILACMLVLSEEFEGKLNQLRDMK